MWFVKYRSYKNAYNIFILYYSYFQSLKYLLKLIIIILKNKEMKLFWNLYYFYTFFKCGIEEINDKNEILQ